MIFNNNKKKKETLSGLTDRLSNDLVSYLLQNDMDQADNLVILQNAQKLDSHLKDCNERAYKALLALEETSPIVGSSVSLESL